MQNVFNEFTQIVYLSHTVPSAAPQHLNNISVDITNITIQWEEVQCLQRNGQINQYKVTYYPTADDDNPSSELLEESHRHRTFTAVGLPPQTSYTFEVEAVNTAISLASPPATLTVVTATPQSE